MLARFFWCRFHHDLAKSFVRTSTLFVDRAALREPEKASQRKPSWECSLSPAPESGLMAGEDIEHARKRPKKISLSTLERRKFAFLISVSLSRLIRSLRLDINWYSMDYHKIVCEIITPE